MSLFEKQIKQRKDIDQQNFEDAIFQAAGVVLGRRRVSRLNDANTVTKQAIDEILKYYHYKPVEFPKSVKDHEEQLDYCLRPYGVMRRRITLEDDWYEDAYGPLLAYTKENGEPVALLPDKIAGYYYVDRASGKKVRINNKTKDYFESEAYSFYRPFAQKQLGIVDLLLYMKQCITISDIVLVILSSFIVTAVGMLMPRITLALTGPVLSGGNGSVLISIAIFMVCTAISTQLFSIIYSMLNARIQTKITLGVQSALMMRVMSLPANFFRQYSSGELTKRSESVGQLCSLLFGIILGTGLSSLMSLLYITQIFSFAPGLVIPSLVIILVTVCFSIFSSVVQIRISKKRMEIDAKESGLSFSILNGIQKIKLSGSEKRFFTRWLKAYTEEAELTYAPPMFIRINSVITLAISLISNIVIYFLAVSTNVAQSNYYAFTAAYGSVMGAFTALAGIALSVGKLKPMFEMAEPFLKTEPETLNDKEPVTKLSGSIELNKVCFRYNESSPYIVNNLSFKIQSGEYVAIVGRTGCGKSTLMRLLLGFEKPEKGAIYYGGRDLNSLDLISLRQKIGSVMQDGGLLQGDIFTNITISAPHLSMDEAWEAAELANIADDIRAMPMGMHTMISEGNGGISGGQKQRIMIARAIVSKPKILIFDEATSALDNKTQKAISEALDQMGCTRIVIAHRLSTIRHCDRILVLEGGEIVEEGSYDELIALDGYFAELVERQRMT